MFLLWFAGLTTLFLNMKKVVYFFARLTKIQPYELSGNYLSLFRRSNKNRWSSGSAGESFDAIAENEVPNRPGRQEPRCVKRRPKPFQFLTKKRHEMKEIPHRSTYRAKQA